MAKKSMIARDAKRLKTVQRFAVKRAALKATISSVHSSDEERREKARAWYEMAGRWPKGYTPDQEDIDWVEDGES